MFTWFAACYLDHWTFFFNTFIGGRAAAFFIGQESFSLLDLTFVTCDIIGWWWTGVTTLTRNNFVVATADIFSWWSV
jgi:hypothetical protein